MAQRVAPENESWEQLKDRLGDELRDNPLDVENPPNPKEGFAQDQVNPMVWTPVYVPGEDETNPDGKNSISLLNSIRKWEMDLPDMYAPNCPASNWQLLTV